MLLNQKNNCYKQETAFKSFWFDLAIYKGLGCPTQRFRPDAIFSQCPRNCWLARAQSSYQYQVGCFCQGMGRERAFCSLKIEPEKKASSWGYVGRYLLLNHMGVEELRGAHSLVQELGGSLVVCMGQGEGAGRAWHARSWLGAVRWGQAWPCSALLLNSLWKLFPVLCSSD